MDVSKQIDRGFRRDETGEQYEWKPSAGPTVDVYAVTAFVRAARDKAGKSNKQIDQHFGFNGVAGHWTSGASQPAVPTWPQWEKLRELLAFDDSIDQLVLTLNGGKGDRSIEGTALAEREVIGTAIGKDAVNGDLYRPGEGSYLTKEYDVTAPATDAAKAWAGWGTALKPAWEPIILARKPFPMTVAQNVLANGTGAINIDACRLPVADSEYAKNCAGDRGHEDNRSRVSEFAMGAGKAADGGRWPANVVLDEDAAAALDAMTGDVGAAAPASGSTRTGESSSHSRGRFAGVDTEAPFYDDRGGASRFFYTAKASRSEREFGLEGIAPKTVARSNGAIAAEGRGEEYDNEDGGFNQTRAARNSHPTVKPVDLMRWLVRLVTPPNGLVLDPFAGSGSTGVAAIAEGFRFVGFELSEEFVAIANARLNETQPSLFGQPPQE